MSAKKILVTGATGQQGGAVVRHLLSRVDFEVRALTRDPYKPAAQALARKSVEVVAGDLDDRASVERALEGIYGVFSVQNFWEAGYEREVQQGKMLADAAQAAGIKHFVFSSVGSAHRRTGLSHFESKWEIEQHLRRIGLPRTILRPVFFMQNWWAFAREPILRGTLPLPLRPEKPLQQISVDDLGAFVTLAFQQPAQWLGRELDIAGEELTMPQVAAVFTRVLGRPVEYLQVSMDEFCDQAGEEMAMMYQWFDQVGYNADIPALRREYPWLATLAQVLHQQDWALAQAKAA